MAVEDPGTFTVTCDDCSETVEADSTEYAGDPRTWGVDEETLEALGWAVVYGTGETYCPDCKDKDEEDE